MTFTVCFIERREGGSPSIERVFRSVAAELEKKDVRTRFVKVPFGNGVLAILLNLIWFRPPKADVFHITGDVHYIALRLPPSRTLLTVHDLTILNLRTGARRWLIERLFYTWPSRRLRYLTTISQATKSRLTALTDMETKIRVVENPLLVSEESEANEFNVREPTILQLGTAPNKNIGRLIEAVSGLRCRLWIVGRIDSEIAKRIEALNIMVRNDKSLGDDAVEEAYRNADIVTLCSTEEGFGLPIIEGQAKGTVVITSDREPMRDVAGDGAMLVDPERVDSIRDGIRKVIADHGLRARLIGAGRLNVKRFAPQRVAGEYFDLYSTILEESRTA